MMPVTIGFVIRLNSNPSFIQTKLNGLRIVGNTMATIRNAMLGAKAQRRGALCRTRGSKAIRAKKTANVSPNALSEGPSCFSSLFRFS